MLSITYKNEVTVTLAFDKGQIFVFIIFLSYSFHILYVYALRHDQVSLNRMRSLWPSPLIARSNNLFCLSYIFILGRTSAFIFFNKLMSRSNKLFLSDIGFLGPNGKEIKTTGLLVIFDNICKLAHSISNSVLKLLFISTNLMFF